MANVLIVDDSTIMREKIKNHLLTLGHTVVAEAANGMDAYSKYIVFKPDLVTMDISMPLMSGIEAVEKIIEKDAKAKIIMVSAMGQKATVLEALKKGARHYVIKPFDKVQLMAVIQKVLGDK